MGSKEIQPFHKNFYDIFSFFRRYGSNSLTIPSFFTSKEKNDTKIDGQIKGRKTISSDYHDIFSFFSRDVTNRFFTSQMSTKQTSKVTSQAEHHDFFHEHIPALCKLIRVYTSTTICIISIAPLYTELSHSIYRKQLYRRKWFI